MKIEGGKHVSMAKRASEVIFFLPRLAMALLLREIDNEDTGPRNTPKRSSGTSNRSN